MRVVMLDTSDTTTAIKRLLKDQDESVRKAAQSTLEEIL